MGLQGPKTGEAGAQKAAANSSVSERNALKTGPCFFIVGLLVLIPAVLVIITGNRILGVGCIVTIVVDTGKARVAIHETNHTLGVAIKGSVLSARFALVPGERRVRGPFHD